MQTMTKTATAPAAPSGEEYLTKRELAVKLRKTPRTIELWMSQGLIPYARLGRSILFHWPTVQESINAKMQGGGR